MEDKCAFRASLAILVIVTGLNLFKVMCIAYTARLHSQVGRTIESSWQAERSGRSVVQLYKRLFRKQRPSNDVAPYLVTIGDAIASFLQEEDHSTKHKGLESKKDFARGWPEAPLSIQFARPTPSHWFWAASKTRWCVTLSL
jgi:hypothetical protein